MRDYPSASACEFSELSETAAKDASGQSDDAVVEAFAPNHYNQVPALVGSVL